jgi:hypothetical protein
MPRKIPDEIIARLQSKEWLQNKHVIQLVSISELSTELGVTPGVIRNALRNHDIQSPTQQILREASNLRKYGVTNSGLVPGSREKAAKTMADKFGGHNWSAGNREQRDTTCLQKYGDTNVGKTEFAQAKAKQTNVRRYGREHVNQLHITDSTYNKLQDKNWLVDQHHTQQKTLLQIADELGFGGDMTTVMRHMRKHDIDTHYFQTSFEETKLVELIRSFYPGNVITNDRQLIAPKELDIYIPDRKIAIEYCGLYWHGESAGKTRTYHQQKYIACEKQGIQLITIYDWEWKNRRYAVEQKLRTVLGVQNGPKTNARDCQPREIPADVAASFYNKHHVQGRGPGSIHYGLYDSNSTLVAAMSFILSTEHTTLNRFATNGRVPGAFTKLLTHFTRNNEWTIIVSFADLRWSTGGVYYKCGFTLDGIVAPEYAYIVNGEPKHKFGFRHAQLPQKIQNYDPTLSEWENMKASGIDRVWDCGKLRYIKYKSVDTTA